MDDGKVKKPKEEPKLTPPEEKLIEQGKATVVDGKLVQSSTGKVEGRV